MNGTYSLKKRRLALMLLLLSFCATSTTLGVEIGDLQATMPNPNNDFTDLYALQVTGAPGRVAVTAQRRDVGVLDSVGEVFLFDDQTGQLITSIPHPEPAEDDEFGYSIDFVNGDLLVGAYANDFGAQSAGSAYLFDGVTGTLQRTIRNPDLEAGAVFGFAVAETTNGYAISARGAGKVYLFDGDTGDVQWTLTNPNVNDSDAYGFSLAEAGGKTVVGARFDRPVPGPKAGSAHVFDTNTGDYLYTLTSANPINEGEFGHSVAASDSKIVVGAPREDVGFASDAGRVYVFDAATGDLEYELFSPNNDDDWFGWNVSVSGDFLLVGVPRASEPSFRTGAVFLYDLETGDYIKTIENPNPGGGDEFGRGLDATDTTVLVGAWENNRGTAYAFTLIPEPNGAMLLGVASVLMCYRRVRS